MKSLRYAFVAACLFALAACGNKGPLMLPQKPAPVETPPPAQAEPVKPVDGAQH